MALVDLIRQYAQAEADADGWDAVAAKLNDPTTVLERSTDLKTSEQVEDVLGRNKYATFADALAASAVRTHQDNRVKLLTVGWNFDSNLIRTIIDDLPLTTALKNDLKQLGRWRVAASAKFLGRIVTAQECQQAYTQSVLQTWLNQRYAAAAAEVAANSITNLGALRIYLGS